MQVWEIENNDYQCNTSSAKERAIIRDVISNWDMAYNFKT